MNKMSLTIDVIGECFVKDIGNRNVYLDAISMLLPMYIVTIWKYDRMHYFAYGDFHINRDTFIKKIDQFTTSDFFEAIQEYAFLNKEQSQRDSFDAALAYIAKINEQRVAVDDNVTILRCFKTKEEYDEFEREQDQIILDSIQGFAEQVTDTDTAKLFASAVRRSYEMALI